MMVTALLVVMSGIGRFYAFSEGQLAQAGLTPCSPTPGEREPIYMRRTLHPRNGSAADTSISGPYTRSKVEDILREELLERVG